MILAVSVPMILSALGNLVMTLALPVIGRLVLATARLPAATTLPPAGVRAESAVKFLCERHRGC